VDPAITACRNRFEKSCLARLVSQCAANLRHDAGQGMVGDRRLGPDAVEDLLFRKQMARPLNHQREQRERLRLERDRHTGAFEAEGVEVEDVVVPAES